ncbi:hypothetical protein EDD66_101437 [Mobilisporobacter senegalensis]|uniref:Golgi phosphoprotein 3 GPP34 n=1 Tax=Mobilisporobacter senegalensis TaxID=1329262 RepID=A0A3N1XZW3_9FIRM|nr:hypothetical protein [Mobilisporobacter senegalensis]ROR31818.1 hypothetical protein EDD66_101437 [Mobilisporobacter senegalensis]
MIDLSLAKGFAAIALNGEVCNHYSLAKKHKMRCVFASVFFDFYLKGIIKRSDGKYVISNSIEEMEPYEQYVYELLREEPSKALQQWINTISKVSYKVCSKLEGFLVEDLMDQNLMNDVSDLLECDMFYTTAGINIRKYRTVPEQYQFELEALRAEVLEEGMISDEAIILLWLLDQSHKLNDVFSKSEIERLSNIKDHLYKTNSLAQEVIPLQIKAILLNGWVRFLKGKKRLFQTKIGMGVAFIFPGLEREQSIFIDTEQWFADKGSRLTQTVALLESKGHICKIKSFGQVSLVEVDNVLYELIPEAVTVNRIPIHGVRLRRYRM